MIKRAVKSALGSVGLEVRRTHRRQFQDLQADPPSAAAGKVLEFIGASGIGKSHLRSRLAHSLPSDWLDSQSVDWTEIEAEMLPRIPSDCQDVYSRICRRFAKTAFKSDLWYRDAEQVMQFLSFQIANIRRHLLLEGGLLKGMVMDEGLIFITRHEILKELNRPGSAVHSILERRVLVAFSAAPEKVVQNIQKRLLERPRLPEYRGFSEKEILDSIQKQQQELRSFLTFIEPHLGGLLQVEDPGTSEDSVEQVMRFVDRISRSAPVTSEKQVS